MWVELARAVRACPGWPPRNSLAGLVRLNRCVQGEREKRRVRQRFRQRCLARSDSRGHQPGHARTAAELRGAKVAEERCVSNATFPCTNPSTSLWVIPAQAGIQDFCWFGAGGSGMSWLAASKLPRGPRTAESLRAGRKGEAARQATIPPTMPGSVRQSRPPARISPNRCGTAWQHF